MYNVFNNNTVFYYASGTYATTAGNYLIPSEIMQSSHHRRRRAGALVAQGSRSRGSDGADPRYFLSGKANMYSAFPFDG